MGYNTLHFCICWMQFLLFCYQKYKTRQKDRLRRKRFSHSLHNLRKKHCQARQKRLQQFVKVSRKRRKRAKLVTFMCLILSDQKRNVNRSIWVKERNTDVWIDNVPFWNDQDWFENTRMSQMTFNYLCRELRPELERTVTHLRDPIPVAKRIMIALWRLATNVEFRTLGQLFGIGRSTACMILHEFCQAVVYKLMPMYVRIPQGHEFRRVVDGFRNKYGIIQCGGAIDGTHIPIIAPKEFHTDYFNRKGWHSVVLQAIVDQDYMCMDICSGWPGSTHDARVFANSAIYEKGMNGSLFPQYIEYANGVEIPVYLIGDPAYPLLPWLMKNYPQANLTREQHHFNGQINRARVVVENFFGRLKGRWRCLLKRYDGDIQTLQLIIGTCVTLHNICEKHRERFDQELINQLNVENFHRNQPVRAAMNVNADPQIQRGIREALKQWLFDNRQ